MQPLFNQELSELSGAKAFTVHKGFFIPKQGFKKSTDEGAGGAESNKRTLILGVVFAGLLYFYLQMTGVL